MERMAEHEQVLLRSQSGPMAGSPHRESIKFPLSLSPYVSVVVSIPWAIVEVRARERGFWDESAATHACVAPGLQPTCC